MTIYMSGAQQQVLLDLMDSIVYAQERDDVDADKQQVNQKFKLHSQILRDIESKENSDDDLLDVWPLALAIANFISDLNFTNTYIDEQLTSFLRQLMAQVPGEAQESTYFDFILDAIVHSVYPMGISYLIDMMEGLDEKPFVAIEGAKQVQQCVKMKLAEQLRLALESPLQKDLREIFADPRVVQMLNEPYLDKPVVDEFGVTINLREQIRRFHEEELDPSIAILTVCTEDANLVQPAVSILKDIGIPYKTSVLGQNNNAINLGRFIDSCHDQNIDILLVAAVDMDPLLEAISNCAHVKKLPAIVALPLNNGNLDNSPKTARLPPGIMIVADDARNAALCCARILSLRYPELEERIAAYVHHQTPASSPLIKKTKLMTTYYENNNGTRRWPGPSNDDDTKIANFLTALKLSPGPT